MTDHERPPLGRGRAWSRGLLETNLVRKFAQYFVVGGISALVDWALFALFLYVFEFRYLLSGTISFVFATAVNYVLSIRYVFKKRRRSTHAEVTLVYIASAVGISINLLVLGGLIEYVGLHAMVSKLAGTASALGWNFGARYYWIFDR